MISLSWLGQSSEGAYFFEAHRIISPLDIIWGTSGSNLWVLRSTKRNVYRFLIPKFVRLVLYRISQRFPPCQVNCVVCIHPRNGSNHHVYAWPVQRSYAWLWLGEPFTNRRGRHRVVLGTVAYRLEYVTIALPSDYNISWHHSSCLSDAGVLLLSHLRPH